MTTRQKLASCYYLKAIKEGKARGEFYTRYEDIEEMLPEWDLSDKKVWALADGDESEFEVIKVYGMAGALVKWRKGFEPKGKNKV